jgi:lipid A disaccharide synthetase
VPELIQDDCTVERLEKEGEALLSSPSRLETMRAGLSRVAGELGPPGASSRAAGYVLSTIQPLRTTSDVVLAAQ